MNKYSNSKSREEIVDALQRCAEGNDIVCAGCPYENCQNCIQTMLLDAAKSLAAADRVLRCSPNIDALTKEDGDENT